MEKFKDYLEKIEDLNKRACVHEVLAWVKESFPMLETRIGWNQPMFTHHGTFILGLSMAKGHLAITPEAAGIREFADKIDEAGYAKTGMIFRIPWDKEVHYPLLEEMIRFNLEDKKDCKTFWRK